MARPREFDEDDVLERARDAFWANGIAATSVANLSQATGLSTGSIYKAFQSKEQLCHRTLDDYLERGLSEAVAALATSGSPHEGLAAWVDDGAMRASGTSPTSGCYAVVCATELAATDPVVRQRLVDHDRDLLAAITDTVARVAGAEGIECQPEAAARLLYVTVNGLQVEARKGISYDHARQVLDLALQAALPGVDLPS